MRPTSDSPTGSPSSDPTGTDTTGDPEQLKAPGRAVRASWMPILRPSPSSSSPGAPDPVPAVRR